MPTALSLYLSDIHAMTPLTKLTKDEEIEIGRSIAEGSVERRTELVVSNLGFVVRMAREYQHRGLPLDDLINEGNVGLVRAAARYDHRRGVKFITYAAFWVRKTILEAIEGQATMIRVPEYQRRKTGRPHPCSRHPISLDDRSEGSETRPRLADTLVDAGRPSPEGETLRREDLARLARSLRLLTERERTVIAGRYGLTGDRPLKLDEIGAAIGVSRERVRQIETTAREKLRAILTRPGGALARG